MLFRTNKGELIEVKKYDFPNDKLYYQKLMEIKKSIKPAPFAKSEQVKSQLNMNILCSYIFTTFIGLLIIFLIKSFL